MATTQTLYGFQKSGSSDIIGTWTAIPTLYLCYGILKIGGSQWFRVCYALQYNGKYFLSDVQVPSVRFTSTTWSSIFSYVHPNDPLQTSDNVNKTCTWYYATTVSGYASSQSAPSTLYCTDGETYSVVSYTYSTYTVRVKKVLDNGTATTVNTNTYAMGATATISIPAAYNNSVLSGVLIDNVAQTYNSSGYSFIVNNDHVILFKFTSTVAITPKKGTGCSSIRVSSTTSFTKETVSSNSSVLSVEKGQPITITGNAEAGYVFYTNALTSSNTNYNSVNGDGTASFSTTVSNSGAATFTLTAMQCMVVPSATYNDKTTYVYNTQYWNQVCVTSNSTLAYNTSTSVYNLSVPIVPNSIITVRRSALVSSEASHRYRIFALWLNGTRCADGDTRDNYIVSGPGSDDDGIWSILTPLSITKNLSLSVQFLATRWKLSVAASDYGTLSFTGEYFQNGASVPITFTPNDDPDKWQLSSVSYNNNPYNATSNVATITTTNSAQTATATVVATRWKLVLPASDYGTFTCDSSDGYYANGAKATITFTPNNDGKGWKLTKIFYLGSNSTYNANNNVVSINRTSAGSYTFTSTIVRTRWRLTVSLADTTYGTITGSGWYLNGGTATIKFTPNNKYSNLGIVAYQYTYQGATKPCSGNTFTITTDNVDRPLTVYVHQTKYPLTLEYGTAGTESWGTLSADKEYVGSDETINLTFTPNKDIVDTIHPQVDHWGLQTSSPKPDKHNEDGSSTTSATIGTITAGLTAKCYLYSSYRRITIKRTDSNEAKWGDFYLGEDGEETVGYYPMGGTIIIRFVRDTEYDATVRPQVDTITAGNDMTGKITGEDGVYKYTYTLPANDGSDLEISCTAKQTAWPVTISSGTGGSITVNKLASDGTKLETLKSGTFYLCTWQYLQASTSANSYYKFSSYSTSNLTNVSTGKYKLSSGANGAITANFSKTHFSITISTSNSSRSSVYFNGNSTTIKTKYFSISTTSNPVVCCKINANDASMYKVSNWSVGGVDKATSYNQQEGFYYVEVTNRTDVTVKANISQSSFKFTLTCSPNDYAKYGTLVVTADGEQVKTFNNDGDITFSDTLKEGTEISVAYIEAYGGRVLGVTNSSSISLDKGEYTYSFKMPSSNGSLAFTLGAKETYPLTIGVKNIAEGHKENIPAILSLKSKVYPEIEIGQTTEAEPIQTFDVYQGEEYVISSATSSDASYGRKYAMLGWQDENDSDGEYIDGALDTFIDVSSTESQALTRMLVYDLRTTGTVTIEYAKQNEDGSLTTLEVAPDGCSFTIENISDKTGDSQWLIGADIKMPYTILGNTTFYNDDTYKIVPVKFELAFGDADYSILGTWDNGKLEQSGEFIMRGNARIRVVFSYIYVPGYTKVNVGYKQDAAQAMGNVSIFATEMQGYIEDSTTASALVQKQKKVVIMASPRPGYAFAGWWLLNDAGEYEVVEDAAAVYEIDGRNVTSPMPTYYADFVESEKSNVKEWNGTEGQTKTFVWQSKVYVGAQFFQMQSVRIYSDAYPVQLTIFGASSPEDIFGDTACKQTITITSQAPQRLPRMHTEKYFVFSVSGTARINHVGISSSMIGLTS